MLYLEELIPQQRYFRFDYLRILKALLPNGALWRIPIPIEDLLQPSSLSSVEQFGVATLLRAAVGLQPVAIPSAEAVSAGLKVGEQFVLPLEIQPAEAIGGLVLVSNNLLAHCPFTIDLCASQGFDAAFMLNWYQTTESGEGIAQRGTGGVDRFFPSAISGKLLTGDLDVIATYWRSAIEAGNTSIHVQFHNSAGTLKFSQEYWGGKTRGVKEATLVGSWDVAPGPVSQPMWISRRSGIVWVYAWNGFGWVRADDWLDPGASYSNSDDVYIKLDGGDAVNGFAEITILGTLV